MKTYYIGIILLSFLLCCSQVALAQEEFTIGGTITNAETGENLIGVNIYEKGTSKGTSSNKYGFYSLTLPEGKYEIVYSYEGYRSIEKEFNLAENILSNIALSPVILELDEIVVTPEKRDHNIRSTEMSTERLSIRQVEKIPALMGEKDILKTIQLMPGINTVSEGRSAFVVRGGTIDQNLILMDEAPIYYSAHMYGLFSIYNPDALEDLTVYKGGIPAKYGGRASSILDLATKNGNNQSFGVSGGIGSMTTRLSIEGPIFKNRSSFFLSGRSSKYSIGQLFEGFEESVSQQNKNARANPYFHDINAKIKYQINDNNRVYASGYFGEDGEGEGSRKWGNTAGSLYWNHIFNPRLFSNTSLTFSDYNYYESGGGIGFTYEYDSGIVSAGLKQDFAWTLNPNNTLNFGFETKRYDFTHGDVTLSTTERDDGGKFMEPMQGLESAVFLSNEQKIGSLFSVNYGLRYSLFNRLGPGNEVTYYEDNSPITSKPFGDWETMSIHGVLEPRVAVTYMLNDVSSLKLSYNRMAQYVRLMNLGMIRNAFDVWMPTTNNIEPIIADQIAAGYFKNFAHNAIEFSAEAYYKSYKNQSDFEDGLHNYFVSNLEAFVATGIGRGYGLELSLKKEYGKLTGWINYNLSRSENKIEEINNNRWYPNVYDQMFNFTSVVIYEIIRNLSLSTSFVYTNGNAITLPSGQYELEGVTFPYYTSRNGYRLPDNHRLDISVKYDVGGLMQNLFSTGRRYETSLEFSVYNVYDRRNINEITFSSSGEEGGSDSKRLQAYGTSYFGIMPSLTFNFKF